MLKHNEEVEIYIRPDPLTQSQIASSNATYYSSGRSTTTKVGQCHCECVPAEFAFLSFIKIDNIEANRESLEDIINRYKQALPKVYYNNYLPS